MAPSEKPMQPIRSLVHGRQGFQEIDAARGVEGHLAHAGPAGPAFRQRRRLAAGPAFLVLQDVALRAERDVAAPHQVQGQGQLGLLAQADRLLQRVPRGLVEDDHRRTLLAFLQPRRRQQLGANAVVALAREAQQLARVAVELLGLVDADVELVRLLGCLAELRQPGFAQAWRAFSQSAFVSIFLPSPPSRSGRRPRSGTGSFS